MNITLFPNYSEINYRKTHYKNVQNVLNGIIFCAICNVDLKQSIILNEKIMMHKTFLCLCCKNCFEKLSDSPNGCVLCSTEIKLKVCDKCHHHMCQRCVYSYYMKPNSIKKLKSCLKCSCNVLWSVRSQAIAVLKCYSSELDSRLLINGEESENKQTLYRYLKNSAESNENCSFKFLNDLRIKYFYDKLICETQPLCNKILKLQYENIDHSPTILTILCKQVLENTCSVLFDFKCMFNDKTSELLYYKIKSILNDTVISKSNENNYIESLKYYQETINVLDYEINKKFSVSLTNLDEENLRPHVLKERNKGTNEGSEKVNHNPKNDINFSVCTSTPYFNLEHVQSKPTNIPLNIFMNLGEIEIKFNEKIRDHHTKVCDETVNQITTCNTKINSDDEKLSMYPVVYLQKLDQEFIDNNVSKIFKNKSANIITSQNIECNDAANMVNINKGLDCIVNLYRFDEKCNNTNVPRLSKNKATKRNRKGNTTAISTKSNISEKSSKCNSNHPHYIHKKFRREER